MVCWALKSKWSAWNSMVHGGEALAEMTPHHDLTSSVNMTELPQCLI